MTVPSIVHPLYPSGLPCGFGSAPVPCARLRALGLLISNCPSFPVSESGRFVCGVGLGLLSGRQLNIDGWFCVWSAQFQPAGAWTSSDCVCSLACVRTGVRVIQRGFLFCGFGWAAADPLSTAFVVFAMLCARMESHIGAPRLRVGCIISRSLVGCGRWCGVFVNTSGLG